MQRFIYFSENKIIRKVALLKKLKTFYILFSLFTLILNSCNKDTPQKNFDANEKTGFKVKDDIGIEVNLDRHPERIVSLAPNVTEALFAVGADSLIAGVTDFCNYPESAKLKPKTGSYLSPDYEKITSLNPDLIIINVESSSNPTYQALKNLNLKLFVSNAKTFTGILKMIRDFGKITGKEFKAEIICDSLSKLKEYYISQNINLKRKKSLILVSVNPLMSANGKTFISEIADYSGVENIYKDEEIEYPSISYEDIFIKGPELIILPADTTDEKKLSMYMNELRIKLMTSPAVKSNRILTVDQDIMYRPGPRIFDGVNIIRNKLAIINSNR